MSEYIEREKMISNLKDEIEAHGNPDSDTAPIAYGSLLGIKYGLAIATALPAADVVKVVRCKDCEFWKHEIDVDFVCTKHYGYRASNDFCSYGKRRAKNGK